MKKSDLIMLIILTIVGVLLIVAKVAYAKAMYGSYKCAITECQLIYREDK